MAKKSGKIGGGCHAARYAEQEGLYFLNDATDRDLPKGRNDYAKY